MKYGRKMLFALIFSLVPASAAFAAEKTDMPTATEESASASQEMSPEETEPKTSAFFDNEEINRLIDENYEQVLANGYAELRIPLSLHGITEEAFTANSLEVGKKLLENGYEAYVVGGCVRDFIMGTESNDIDITTNATLEQQQEIFGDALETHSSGGMVFGGVVFPDELVDLATYQNVPKGFYGVTGVPEFDTSETNSSSALLDSFQRDLTMNAIYYDLATGDLVDYHGGIHDIREHVLNTMVDGLISLQVDPRVTVRAMRFKARYGFEFSESLEQAVRTYGQTALANMRQNDIFVNIGKMMISGYALESSHILQEYDMLDIAYPPVIRLVDDADYLDYLDKALEYMDGLRAESGENNSDMLALLAFLQPEIDRRAKRSDYEIAMRGVLDEQETSFNLRNIRSKVEAISQLAHDMENVSSRFLCDAVRQSEYFEDARSLLYMNSLRNRSLEKQVEFWNADDEQSDEDVLDKAS